MPLDRVPPHNSDAEITVIASLLLDEEGEAIHEIIDKLSPNDFYKEAHKIIITGIMKLFSEGQPINLISLTEELKKEEKIVAIGGQAYLSSLVNASISSIINIEYYLDIIRGKAELRRLIKGATQILDLAYTDTENSDDIVDKAETIVLEVAEQRFRTTQKQIKDLVDPTMDHIEKMWKAKGEITGLPTGFTDFDQMTNGLHPSELVIIAARPSMGKTAFCLNVCLNTALKFQKKVAIFSLEMSSLALVQRMICTQSRISAHKIQKGVFSHSEWVEMTNVASALKEAKIWIDDNAGLSYMDIRSKCRRLASKNNGLDLVIIDYLQLISPPPGFKNSNRNLEISDISRNLKILAKELSLPVICLSQLNRKVEDRTNPIPILSDLRDSGAIEQDADLVAFLHRPDYYDKARAKKQDEESEFEDENQNLAKAAEIIIAKQRNGPVGTIKLTFLAEFMRFENYTDERRSFIGY